MKTERISPRLIGVCVVCAVMFIPNVPVGYLTPLAVFLGALATFLVSLRRA